MRDMLPLRCCAVVGGVTNWKVCVHNHVEAENRRAAIDIAVSRPFSTSFISTRFEVRDKISTCSIIVGADEIWSFPKFVHPYEVNDNIDTVVLCSDAELDCRIINYSINKRKTSSLN